MNDPDSRSAYLLFLGLPVDADRTAIEEALRDGFRLWNNRSNAPALEKRVEAAQMIKRLSDAEATLLKAQTRPATSTQAKPVAPPARSSPPPTPQTPSVPTTQPAAPTAGRPSPVRSVLLVCAVLALAAMICGVAYAFYRHSSGRSSTATPIYAPEPTTTYRPNSGSGTTDAKQAATLLNKALQEQVSGNTSQAQTDFIQVIRLDPRNKFGHYNLGLIAQNAGDQTTAESEYRQAITIDPNYTPALYNLGILRAQAGATQEAIALYRRAVGSDPRFADGYFNLGLLVRASGDIAEGNNDVQTAVRLDPTLAAKAQAQGVPLPGR